MELGIDKAKLLQYKASLAKHLSNPAKLRLLVVGVLGLGAIAAVYLPFSDRIQQCQADVRGARQRQQAIRDVEKLRDQATACEQRIGKQSDTNEWVQYVLEGLRGFPVKLRDMESRPPRPVGPYVAVTLSLEIEATYPRMRQFVEWLEQSDRILRVDSVRIERHPRSLSMKIVILGLVHKNASAN